MHPRELDHMRSRKEHLTYRELGKEFRVSKSHAHRLLKEKPDAGASIHNVNKESLDPDHS